MTRGFGENSISHPGVIKHDYNICMFSEDKLGEIIYIKNESESSVTRFTFLVSNR